jgi:hypothetical protein
MEITMDADEDFETFLDAWTNERLWPMGDLLDNRDLQYMAERRAVELIQLAKEKGFATDLTETVGGYGSVLAYVQHLLWEADYRATRSRPSNAGTDS